MYNKYSLEITSKEHCGRAGCSHLKTFSFKCLCCDHASRSKLFCNAVYLTGFWKPYLLAQDFWENTNENFKINFLHIWIKQLLNLLAMKFHTHSFFPLGDMDDYIRPCSNFTWVGQQLHNLQIRQFVQVLQWLKFNLRQ